MYWNNAPIPDTSKSSPNYRPPAPPPPEDEAKRRARLLSQAIVPSTRLSSVFLVLALILGAPMGFVLGFVVWYNHGTNLQSFWTLWAGVLLSVAALLFLIIRGVVERIRARR